MDCGLWNSDGQSGRNMMDTGPRSWRSILFRPGRPALRPRTAILLCIAILAANVALDVLLLTNARVLGRIASIQIRKHAGDLVTFDGLTMTLGGQIKMDRVRLRLTNPGESIFEARRVRISIGHREGGIVAESLQLDEPRIRFSDRIAREISGGDSPSPRAPLRELFPARYLPRVSCRNGTLELGHSDVLASDEPQVFRILDLAMIPTTGYRYFVRGILRNDVVGEWSIQGEVDLETGDHRVLLSNRNLVIGSAIRDALHPRLHPVVDKYGPAGPASADIYLECDRTNPEADTGFRLTLKPRGMSVRYRNFSYPCEDMHGEIDFRANGFTVKHIEARNGKTKIRFDGSADGYEAEAAYHFRLEMDDVAFDEALRSALKENAQDVWARFKPSGKLDARITIHRERGGPEVKESLPVDLQLKGATLTYAEFPYTVERATGEIRVHGDDVLVKRVQGVHGRTELSFSGRIDSISQDPEIDLDARIQSLELDGRLRDALKPETRQVFDRLGASGDVDVDLRILRSKGGPERLRALVRTKGNRIVVRDAPLPVLIREGTVEYNEGRVRLHNLKGSVDPAGEVVIQGEILPGADGSTTHLEVDGMGVPIDDRFRDRMPKALGEVLRSLKISGIADFKFTLDERPERDRAGTRVRLHLDLRKGSISSAVPVEDIDGTVVLVGPIRDGRPMLSGRIDIRSARVLKKLIRNFTTNFAIQGPVLDFRDISGDSYGGKLSGWFSLDTVTSDLEADIAVSRLDLRDFINDTAKWSGKTISGKVDLWIPSLTGKANDLATLKSTGCSLKIVEGQLLDVPGIITFLNPIEPEGRFTAMKAYFDIRSQKFVINEFAFLGREGTGSVIGKGTFNFDGRFRLKIKTETGSLLGIPFFIFDIPGKLFDLLKSPLKVVVEGDLESSKLLEADEKD